MQAPRITHIAFLTPANYAAEAPAAGLEQALRLLAHGEALGYDGAWVRQRHLERGVSSAATFLAAATQRTRRIELGAAVIQLGYENLFRLAEDLATVDVLSGGRLQVGLSAGAPPLGALLGERLFDAAPEGIDFSHQRVLRLRRNLSGEWLGEDEQLRIESPAGPQRPRLQPHAPGLATRLWYGAGSRASVAWAGRQGLHLLIGNLLQAGPDEHDFLAAQAGQLDHFEAREPHAAPEPADAAPTPAPRVALGRVILPWDGAGPATRRRYQAFAEARHARTLGPQGPRRTLYAPDLVGSADAILERLRRDPVLARVRELRLELPYDLPAEDSEQILDDFARLIAPELGWRPGAAARGGGAPAPRPEALGAALL